MVIMPVFDGDEADGIINEASLCDTGFLFYLLFVSVPDWNRDLSPWKADEPSYFAGGGADYLDFVTGPVLDETMRSAGNIDPARLGIIGYSLAGLFSLWSAYRTDLFKTAASCSGSLWYDGFVGFMRSSGVKRKMSVYLSLGVREERSRNRFFSLIGDRTREALEILKSDNNVEDAVLTMNPGGHGTDAEKRVCEALKWCLERI